MMCMLVFILFAMVVLGMLRHVQKQVEPPTVRYMSINDQKLFFLSTIYFLRVGYSELQVFLLPEMLEF